MQADDLPILGEPISVELANTWYGEGADAVDFLSVPAVAVSWVALVTGAVPVDDVSELRALRDAVRALFVARAAGRALPSRAMAIVNAHAASGRVTPRLKLGADGAPVTVLEYSGRGAVRTRLALSCMEVLTAPAPLVRCAGEGCGLFFVQQHGRRRFCHDGCSHRLRQRRYRERIA